MKRLLFALSLLVCSVAASYAGFLSGAYANMSPTGTFYYQYGDFTQKLTIEDGIAQTWGDYDLEYDGFLEDYGYTQYSYWIPGVYGNQEVKLLLSMDYKNLIVGNMKFRKVKKPKTGSSSGGASVSPSYGSGSTYSSGSGSVNTTCRICGGSGTCTSCGGQGGSWADTGYYTGSNSKSWIDCSSCRGSKRCFNCHGSGRQ